jgi:hypothetical protein
MSVAHISFEGGTLVVPAQTGTRRPRATGSEMIHEVHLQQRSTPVLTWPGAEIRLPLEA